MRAELVSADEGSGEIAEELIVVVQFAAGARVDIAGVQRGALHGFPAQHRQVLAIALTPGIEQSQLSAAVRDLMGIDIEIAEYFPAFIPES